MAEFYGMITHLDFETDRILDVPKAKGMHDGTLIILAGDNGLALGCHGRVGKQPYTV